MPLIQSCREDCLGAYPVYKPEPGTPGRSPGTHGKQGQVSMAGHQQGLRGHGTIHSFFLLSPIACPGPEQKGRRDTGQGGDGGGGPAVSYTDSHKRPHYPRRPERLVGRTCASRRLSPAAAALQGLPGRDEKNKAIKVSLGGAACGIPAQGASSAGTKPLSAGTLCTWPQLLLEVLPGATADWSRSHTRAWHNDRLHTLALLRHSLSTVLGARDRNGSAACKASPSGLCYGSAVPAPSLSSSFPLGLQPTQEDEADGVSGPGGHGWPALPAWAGQGSNACNWAVRGAGAPAKSEAASCVAPCGGYLGGAEAVLRGQQPIPQAQPGTIMVCR